MFFNRVVHYRTEAEEVAEAVAHLSEHINPFLVLRES